MLYNLIFTILDIEINLHTNIENHVGQTCLGAYLINKCLHYRKHNIYVQYTQSNTELYTIMSIALLVFANDRGQVCEHHHLKYTSCCRKH